MFYFYAVEITQLEKTYFMLEQLISSLKLEIRGQLMS